MNSKMICENTSVWLDALRGSAAQLVVAGHAISLFYSGYPLGGSDELYVFYNLLYAISEAPHPAVVTFFVMSGYLVGGNLLINMKDGCFNLTKYLVDRTSRLFVVLFPALVLTLIFDSISFYYGYGYDNLIKFFPAWWLQLDPWGWKTFVSNAFFLQNIVSFQYGTNLPLWSLSFEFWFYMLMPCVCAFYFYGINKKIIGLTLGFSIIIMFFYSVEEIAPNRFINFLFFFMIWFAGALSRLINEKFKILTGYIFFTFICILSWFDNLLYISRFQNDIIVSLIVIIFIFISQNISGKYIAKYAKFIANYSYSTYAIHYPVIFFIKSISSAGVFAIIFESRLSIVVFSVFLVNVLAILFWFFIERNTFIVRNYFTKKLT